MLVDLHGIVITANKECEKIFGRSQNDIVGLSVNEYAVPDDAKISIDYINDALNSRIGEKAEFTKRFYHSSGRIITFEISSTLLHDKKGKPLYFISHIKDITRQLEVEQQQIELNKRLSEMVEELKEANETRDKFMRIIAHDLRNPFNAIIGFTGLLSENVEQFGYDDIKKIAAEVHSTSLKTFKLLETLLEWSVVQKNKMEFNPIELNVREVFGTVINLVTAVANTKGITVNSRLKDDVIINADRNMLTTIVRNLMSNAIKFTPDNGLVEVDMRIADNSVLFSVTDTGVGMSEEQIASLFVNGSNISTLGTNSESGTGLGLLLCKEFVERHGGSIDVKSSVGKGSTFSFAIPYNHELNKKSDMVLDASLA